MRQSGTSPLQSTERVNALDVADPAPSLSPAMPYAATRRIRPQPRTHWQQEDSVAIPQNSPRSAAEYGGGPHMSGDWLAVFCDAPHALALVRAFAMIYGSVWPGGCSGACVVRAVKRSRA